jgi:Zn-dependent protease with chaperone function
MTRERLSELTSVLPGWVPWAGPLFALGTFGAVYLIVRWFVVHGALRAASRHDAWTERARHVHVARIGAAIAVLLLPVAGVIATISFVGPLTPIPRTPLALMLAAAGAVSAVLASAAVERYVHGQSGEGLLHSVLGVVISYSPLLALAALGWFAPSELTNWTLVPWLTLVCAVVYVWLRAPLVILHTPLAADAGPRTSGIVERASETLSVNVDRVIEFRTRQPNAFAFPWLNVLAYTTGLLDALDDDELEAITHHELAHLTESAGLTRLRQAQLYALVPIVATRPLLGTLGIAGPIAAVLLFVAVTEIVRRRGLAAEHASDSAAVDAIHHSEVYGRALEKTYRLGLIPAVLRRATHGQLHERLEAAGVDPDFEPPLPPSGFRPLVALGGVLMVFLAAWFSPWLLYAVAGGESEAPIHLASAFPVYGSEALETQAFEAEFEERFGDAAILYEAAASVRPDNPFLRSEAVRAWAFAGDCSRASEGVGLLDRAEHAEDVRYAEEWVDWCEQTWGQG